MVAQEKISGRIASRVVGILELASAVIVFGIFIWLTIEFYVWESKPWHRKDILLVTFFGVYFLAGIFMSGLLILSTFSVMELSARKWISVAWCLFNMISFIGTVVFICICDCCQSVTKFLLMIGFLIKLALFFCIVCTYVWGISEKILDKKLYKMPMSPVVRRSTRQTSA